MGDTGDGMDLDDPWRYTLRSTQSRLMYHEAEKIVTNWQWRGARNYSCLVILRGVPGSGKSSIAAQIKMVPKQHTIARQVPKALAYLHDQQIVHGRVNAFNVLLDSVFAVFHYVRLFPLDYECAVVVALEVQRGQQPTEKADVFAFGV